jgi:NAD+ kinase
MTKVGLVLRRSKPEAARLALEMSVRLRSEGIEVVRAGGDVPVPGVPEATSEELGRCDLVVVLGGDGTLLHAARLLDKCEVPLLGVNLGSLGFMTDVPADRAMEALDHVLAGRCTFERRTKLAVRVERGGEPVLVGEALNDAVVSKNALARVADIGASVGGRRLATLKADGVIVSTPTGSSAYGLAAGGPLVHPDVPAMVVTPICPHTLTLRPIVLPDHLRVELELLSDGEMFVTLDGHSGCALAQGDRVVVERSDSAVVLARADHADYFEVLRRKLRWGER